MVFSILTLAANLHSQDNLFSVVLDTPENGTFEVTPSPGKGGKYPAGTVLTVSASPDENFILDALYYSVPGRWGQMYFESMESPFQVTVNQDMHIGASFIEKSAVEHIEVTQDVVYAKPGVKALKYDVFSPKGAENLPCIIIIHGGGWATNTEDIMRGMARELTRGGKFVVFSIDYRWAQKLDGDIQNNTMADILQDVFGAIVHIVQHAAEYGGDPTRIGLTGDSAGGHLSAAASLMTHKIGSAGFGKTPGIFEFMPSYMPAGKEMDQVRSELMAAIQAAAPSYGVFGGQFLNHFSDDPAANDSWREAISPLYHIPDAKVRSVPQYLIRGTRDMLIKDEMVREFMEALEKAGQRVQYVQVGGAGHAFFDWKPDSRTKATFYQYGVYYTAEMKAFFMDVLYN